MELTESRFRSNIWKKFLPEGGEALAGYPEQPLDPCKCPRPGGMGLIKIANKIKCEGFVPTVINMKLSGFRNELPSSVLK